MFIVRALASIAFVFLPLAATAQITLAPDDLRLSLGMTWEQEIATVLSSLEDSGLDIGSAGADQSSDLTGIIANSVLAFIRSSVLSLEQVPDAASFSDADYSVHNILTAPNGMGGTDEIETYHYFQHSPVGDVLIGAEGPAGQVAFPLVNTGTPWPLEFGKSWAVENFSLDQSIPPGVGDKHRTVQLSVRG